MAGILTINGSMEHLNDPIHLIRHRLNFLLTNLTNKPVTTVCARTGFGKTRAVSDYLRWANNPDIIVFDDIHLSIDASIHEHLRNIAEGTSADLKLILIFHEIPAVLKSSVDALRERDLVSELNEADLNFNEIELANCLKQQNVFLDTQTLREIYKDTGGWAFAINPVVRSLKRIPKYTGFVQSRLKPNIFEFMETANWATISDGLKRFLIRLSLVDRLDAEFVNLLAENMDCKEELLSEFKKQIAYIKFDNSEGIYFIHDLYLDFLREKQSILKNEEKNETISIAVKYQGQSAAV
jgi:LuxR family maltose regulon positive regulatory protein